MDISGVNKKEILRELGKIGITEDNVLSVYLFGSNYWGYANEQSDIDLYVIVKEDVGFKQLDLGKISFRYICTLEETKEAILKGSWARFYVLKFASRLLIGKKVVLPNYPKEKALAYIDGKREDVEKVVESPLKWGYMTLMVRIFLINYLFLDINSFDLKAYEKCNLLSEKEKEFIDMLYDNLFNHKDVDIQEKRKIVKIIDKLEEYIRKRLT
ncbi:MAG: nucleotidyltransferase domain-containing protein [Candidatus Dojkabacteria bacterium]|jgi:predicted nucleotidyltransferase